MSSLSDQQKQAIMAMRQQAAMQSTQEAIQVRAPPQLLMPLQPAPAARLHSPPRLAPTPPAAAALVTRTATQSITSKCFNGCVSDPDQDLSRRQKTCIAECQDNYVKVMQLVAQSMKETGDRMG
jgi:hypothetical protein